MSNRRPQFTTFVSVLVLVSPLALAGGSLEPCINGGVSASGTHGTQAAEDRVMNAGQHALEPCMNGGVSALGGHASQHAADADRAAGNGIEPALQPA